MRLPFGRSFSAAGPSSMLRRRLERLIEIKDRLDRTGNTCHGGS